MPAQSTGDAHLVVRHGLLHHDLGGAVDLCGGPRGHDEGGRDEQQDGHLRCYGPVSAAPRTLRPTYNHWLGITTPCCRFRCPCQRGGLLEHGGEDVVTTDIVVMEPSLVTMEVDLGIQSG